MSESDKQSKSFIDTIKEHLTVLSNKAGVDSRIVIGGLAVCLFFVFIGYFDHYITTIVGVAYPAFWSMRAIESAEQDDDKQWLTYWVVFSLFSVLDLFSGFVLRFIPFYFFFKLIFLIWCFLPNFRGAAIVYDLVLVKIFKKYEKEIEDGLNSAVGQVTNVAKKGTKFVNDNKGKIINAGIDAATKSQ